MDQTTSAAILERFRLNHGKDIDLTLRDAYSNLLLKLGAPQNNLPPTIVVAGTNGKGSTCAFLRAMIEAEGKKVHVYTSPHLVSFYERIRIAGTLVSEEELTSILTEAEALAEHGSISIFEASTAAALVAFARHKADAALLEVGLGGRLDATNVVPKPIGTVITRLSFDHRDYLGDSMAQIAREKAGIMRRDVPCFIAPQPSNEALQSLIEEADKKSAPLFIGGKDWLVEKQGSDTFRFVSPTRNIDRLPLPSLCGEHQLWNAGLAIVASGSLPFSISDESIRQAMTQVEWAGRLQKIETGILAEQLETGNELWLDGGHNDSAGEVLALQMAKWKLEDPKPIDLIFGMLVSKRAEEFLAPLQPYVRNIVTVPTRGEVPGYTAQDLAEKVAAMHFNSVKACPSIAAALQATRSSQSTSSRTLICGSLSLVGKALRINLGIEDTNS